MESNHINPKLDIIGDLAQIVLLFLGIAYAFDSKTEYLLGLTFVGVLTVIVYSQRVIGLEEHFRTPFSDAIIVLSGVSVIFYLLDQTQYHSFIPNALVLKPLYGFLFIIMGIFFKFLLVDEAIKEFSLRVSLSSYAYFQRFLDSQFAIIRIISLLLFIVGVISSYFEMLEPRVYELIIIVGLNVYFIITALISMSGIWYFVRRGISDLLILYYLYFEVNISINSPLFWINIFFSIIWLITLPRVHNVILSIYDLIMALIRGVKSFFKTNWKRVLRTILIITSIFSLFSIEHSRVSIGFIDISLNVLVSISLILLAGIDKVWNSIKGLIIRLYYFFTITIPDMVESISYWIIGIWVWIKSNLLLFSRYIAFLASVFLFIILPRNRVVGIPLNLSVMLILLSFAFYTQLIRGFNAIVSVLSWFYYSVLAGVFRWLRTTLIELYGYIRANPILSSRYFAFGVMFPMFFEGPKTYSINIWTSLGLLIFAFYPQFFAFISAFLEGLISLLLTLRDGIISFANWIMNNPFRSFRYICLALVIPFYFLIPSPQNLAVDGTLLLIGFSPTLLTIFVAFQSQFIRIKDYVQEDFSRVSGYFGLFSSYVAQRGDLNFELYIVTLLVSSIFILHGWNGKIAKIFDRITLLVVQTIIFFKFFIISALKFVWRNLSLVNLFNLISLAILLFAIFYPLFIPLERNIWYTLGIAILSVIVFSLPTKERREWLKFILSYVASIPAKIIRRLGLLLKTIVILLSENIILVTTWVLFFFLSWIGVSLVFTFISSPLLIIFKTKLAFQTRLVDFIVAFTFISVALGAQGWTYSRRERLRIRRSKK